MADEAWMDGDELLLKRIAWDVRVLLTDIIDADSGGRSHLSALQMRRPRMLGNSVRFAAPPRMGRDIRVALRRRIADARRHA